MSKPYSTWHVNQKIRKLKDNVSRLPSIDTDINDVSFWERAVKRFAIHVYRDQDPFGQKIDANVHMFSDSPMVRRSELLIILTEMQEEIKATNLPDDYTAPRAKAVIGIIGVVLGIVIAAVLLDFILKKPDTTASNLPDEQISQPSVVSMDTTAREAVPLESNPLVITGDLELWIRKNNSQFNHAFDSVYQRQTLGGVVKFAETWSADRGFTIDSFFVRLEALGVNTDTLGIDRGLPIEVGQALKGKMGRLGFDQPIIDREVDRLDRL